MRAGNERYAGDARGQRVRGEFGDRAGDDPGERNAEGVGEIVTPAVAQELAKQHEGARTGEVRLVCGEVGIGVAGMERVVPVSCANYGGEGAHAIGRQRRATTELRDRVTLRAQIVGEGAALVRRIRIESVR